MKAQALEPRRTYVVYHYVGDPAQFAGHNPFSSRYCVGRVVTDWGIWTLTSDPTVALNQRNRLIRDGQKACIVVEED